MDASCTDRVPSKVLTAAQAAALIPSGSRIVISGFATIGIPQAILDAMIESFHRTGAPADLTLYHLKVMELCCFQPNPAQAGVRG